MKEIAIWVIGCLALPLVLLPATKAFHKHPELFGLTPLSVSAKESVARDELLQRAKKCRFSVDPKTLNPKKLNDAVADCEASLK
jgi:hypothetical protein